MEQRKVRPGINFQIKQQLEFVLVGKVTKGLNSKLNECNDGMFVSYACMYSRPFLPLEERKPSFPSLEGKEAVISFPLRKGMLYMQANDFYFVLIVYFSVH